MNNTPMTWTWAGWEPLQFYRRLGGFHEAQEGNALWAEEWSELLHSERTAEALADAGIGWVTTHFFKGFGLEIEAEEIEKTALMVRNFHKHGVKVFAYVQYATIVPETLFDEIPEAALWQRKGLFTPYGKTSSTYGPQYWRSLPCSNHRGFVEYLKLCIGKAAEIDVDGIWIDNLNADGCHCDACQSAFRECLEQTVSDPWNELGLRNVDRVLIPTSERPRDPVYQAWTRFRCDQMRASAEILTAHARKLKPGIHVCTNIGIGSGQRHTLDNGDWLTNLEVFDFTYAENGLMPAWRDNQIISQQFPMKIADAIGIKIVPGAGCGSRSGVYPRAALPGERLHRRLYAESAMYGWHAVGGPWGLRGQNGEEPLLLKDAAYRQRNARLAECYGGWAGHLADTTDASPVAILYSFEATAFDEAPSQTVIKAMSQLLLQNQIPFRYVLSDRLEKLADVKLLIIPHVLPVSDSLAEEIRSFVRRGGKVMATGRTSLYDESMRMRRDYALADLFGVHFSNAFEDANHHAMIVNSENGCVLLPGEWGLKLDGSTQACEIAGDRIVRTVRDMLTPDAMPEILSPLPHIATAIRLSPEGKRVVALLNYADQPVKCAEIRFAGNGKTQKSIVGLDTVTGRSELAPVELPDGRLKVTVPVVDVEYFVLLDN